MYLQAGLARRRRLRGGLELAQALAQRVLGLPLLQELLLQLLLLHEVRLLRLLQLLLQLLLLPQLRLLRLLQLLLQLLQLQPQLRLLRRLQRRLRQEVLQLRLLQLLLRLPLRRLPRRRLPRRRPSRGPWRLGAPEGLYLPLEPAELPLQLRRQRVEVRDLLAEPRLHLIIYYYVYTLYCNT